MTPLLRNDSTLLRNFMLLLALAGLPAMLAGGCSGDGQGEGDAGAVSANDVSGGIDAGISDNDSGGISTDTGGTQDTGGTPPEDTADGPDSGTPDAGPTADTGPDCPGEAGCTCTTNSECDSGACLDTQDGKVCAKSCVENCPVGFACKKFGASDVVFVCFPQWTSICSPCSKHGDCKTEGSESRCLDYLDKDGGSKGSFCGAACKDDSSCPDGYTCEDGFDKDAGETFKQCKLKDPAAVCSCSKWSVTAGYTTQCKVSNDIGTCTAERKCTANGMAPCAALSPSAEVCNGTDDDCDGTLDNLPAAATCAVSATLPDGSEASCSGTPVCKSGKQVCEGAQTPTAEGCDGIDNDCNGKTDDVACDDGDACTVDKCDAAASKCSNEPGSDCDDKNPCTADSCDKKAGTCVNKPQDGSCDDGDACTVGDKCAIDGADPKGAKAICAAGTEKKDCADGNLCTDDSCDKEKGCVNVANAATETCFSGADGTEGKGECKSGAKTCKDGKLQAKCVGETVPNATEECDGKDDDCNGTTDEGCKIERAHAAFGSGFGKITPTKAGAKTTAWYVIGGWVVGTAKPKDSKNKNADVGFIYWLMTHWQ